MSLAARVLLFLVRVYQSFFSVLMPSACKFYPSCSHYGAEALRVHGARRGSWLALKRIARCHPFSRGGVDLVPDAGENQTTLAGADVLDTRDCGFGSEKRQTEVCPTQTGASAETVSIGCHSERSEESLFDLSPTRAKAREILRFAQNDKLSSFLAASEECAAETAASPSTEFSTSYITNEVRS